MAVFKKGILDGLSGTIGPIIIAKWKGIFYVRSRPDLPKKPKNTSPAKLASQKKFSYTNKFLALFRTYILIGFKHQAVGQTEANAAFAANYHTAILGAHPDLKIAFPMLKLSVGSLPGLLDLQLVYDNRQGLIRLAWKPDSRRRAKFDDQVILVVYCEKQKLVDGRVGVALRRDYQCSFKIDSRMIGAELQVYLSLASLNRSSVSDSQYLGAI